jgi:hypothetical protein
MVAAAGRKMTVVSHTLYASTRLSTGHDASRMAATTAGAFAALLDHNAAAVPAAKATAKVRQTMFGVLTPISISTDLGRASRAVHNSHVVAGPVSAGARGLIRADPDANTVAHFPRASDVARTSPDGVTPIAKGPASVFGEARHLIRAVPRTSTAAPFPRSTAETDVAPERDKPMAAVIPAGATDATGAPADHDATASIPFSALTNGTVPAVPVRASAFMGLGVFGRHNAVAGGTTDQPIGIPTEVSGDTRLEVLRTTFRTLQSSQTFEEPQPGVVSYSTVSSETIAGAVEFCRADDTPDSALPSLLLDPIAANAAGEIQQEPAARFESAQRAPIPTMLSDENFSNLSVLVTGDEGLQLVVRSDSKTSEERSRLLRLLSGVANEFGFDIHELTLDGSIESVAANYRGGSDGRSAN